MKSKFTAIEIESITGRILKQLYQNENVQIKPFEKTDLEDNFYDYEDCNPFDFVEDTPYQCPVRCDFKNKEHMIKTFKEKFNIE